MKNWSRVKVDSSEINDGNEYEKGSRVSRQNLNAMVNSGLFAQDFAEKLVENIDISEIGFIGEPNVTIIDGDGATIDKPYKKFKFSNLKGEKGTSINRIIKTSHSELEDTYTIFLTDGTGTDFTVTNGKGILNIQKTSSSGLIDTYTIYYNDNSTSTFEIKNGNGIVDIQKTSSSGLVDTYTIYLGSGAIYTFTVTNGDSVDMRVSDGYFQWKRTLDTDWNNLIAISEIASVDQTLSLTSTNAIANLAVAKKMPQILWQGTITTSDSESAFVPNIFNNIEDGDSIEIEFKIDNSWYNAESHYYKIKNIVKNQQTSATYYVGPTAKVTQYYLSSSVPYVLDFYIPMSRDNTDGLYIRQAHCIKTQFVQNSSAPTISIMDNYNISVLSITKIPNGVNYG